MPRRAEPGESLVLTRDGASIATISSTVDVVQGAVVVTEIEEPEPGVRYDGPVRWLLDAGAGTPLQIAPAAEPGGNE
ncbi:hypothetical protein DMB42_01505 [Nonomuraea sp. WAC 01424]|uniref:hypothetical protein n=1 Tax=Nonomuraea sp. WAC 01424 TaxID=2203200 RepID=UPI000F7A81CF|nr:hypothetical protein [Nonomuraea sp. WAC 01424]RSN15537.1 hypothetical protein DMB42_01505 [Nonomuraea sp. WAC 01424]